VGTFDMVQPLTNIAANHPDKKYIIFDVPVDYSNGQNKNVYSVSYNYSEGAFVGGVIAAGMTKTNKVGIVGAMDIPVVNDFAVGIIQGAKYKNKDIKVSTKYVGDFRDPAKGKEIALAQYNSGIDIIANGAAISGSGVIDAAKEKKKLVIGTDSDQAMLFKETDIEKAKSIPVSIMKRVDLSLVRAIDLYIKGELKFGTAEVLGAKEKCIDITRNEFYEELVPDGLKKEVEDVLLKIANGEIKVESAMGMSKEKLDEIRNSAN
jgi:basic membrane protein A